MAGPILGAAAGEDSALLDKKNEFDPRLMDGAVPQGVIDLLMELIQNIFPGLEGMINTAEIEGAPVRLIKDLQELEQPNENERGMTPEKFAQEQAGFQQQVTERLDQFIDEYAQLHDIDPAEVSVIRQEMRDALADGALDRTELKEFSNRVQASSGEGARYAVSYVEDNANVQNDNPVEVSLSDNENLGLREQFTVYGLNAESGQLEVLGQATPESLQAMLGGPDFTLSAVQTVAADGEFDRAGFAASTQGPDGQQIAVYFDKDAFNFGEGGMAPEIASELSKDAPPASPASPVPDPSTQPVLSSTADDQNPVIGRVGFDNPSPSGMQVA